MSAPPGKWTKDEITADAAAALAIFRKTRFDEPLEKWGREVDRRSADFTRLFDEHGVAKPHELTADDIPGIVDAKLLDALRYLPGPPISEDDLKNLADVESLSSQRLRSDPAAAQRVLDVIRKTIDPRRFRWLAEDREPTGGERATAIFASALLHTAQRLQSARRSIAKKDQEFAVRDYLKSIGFAGKRVAKKISTYAQFPAHGIVSENEIDFGPERADVLARLWDDRMLPIECKVSNSGVNSYKRLNHDTLAKHTAWIDAFGRANVVPSAMLAGVFSVSNVLAAQAAGLTIFWSHRMTDLGLFVESTR
ncbi:MAG TPA: XamI family restriction endonuclease [Candidatus Baltobacteraceae bacterium]